MSSVNQAEITRVLRILSDGDQSAVNQLMPMVYDEFRKIAAHYFKREDPDHTLQPTALVHEAYLKLVDTTKVDWRDRNHFFAMGAQTMRRILVDHAKRKKRLKRGGGWERISLDEGLALSREKTVDVLLMEEALNALEEWDSGGAKVVELRFYGGLTEAEVAEAMGLSKRTAQREWRAAKAWLRDYLAKLGCS